MTQALPDPSPTAHPDGDPRWTPERTRRPSVLFVCVHNAGRSQMAAGWLTALAGDAIEVRSAGTTPAEAVNPVAVAVMAEVGIDIAAAHPKLLTDDAAQTSDVVITMGCGDTCPYYPGTRYLDWPLDDPAGQPIEAVRPIRDAIRTNVEDLIAELLPGQGRHARQVDPDGAR
jgi:arsenate reductase